MKLLRGSRIKELELAEKKLAGYEMTRLIVYTTDIDNSDVKHTQTICNMSFAELHMNARLAKPRPFRMFSMDSGMIATHLREGKFFDIAIVVP